VKSTSLKWEAPGGDEEAVEDGDGGPRVEGETKV